MTNNPSGNTPSQILSASARRGGHACSTAGSKSSFLTPPIASLAVRDVPPHEIGAPAPTVRLSDCIAAGGKPTTLAPYVIMGAAPPFATFALAPSLRLHHAILCLRAAALRKRCL
jgi:hypothetical protein